MLAVTCEHIATLCDADTFKFQVRRAKPHKAPKQLQALISSSLSGGGCSNSDVVEQADTILKVAFAGSSEIDSIITRGMYGGVPLLRSVVQCLYGGK